MTLTMKTYSKGVTRFEWSDEDAETTITVESTDTEEAMVRKLKRVVALVEGREPLPVREPGAMLPPASQAAPAPAVGNGWASIVPAAAPELPDDRKGEWELIPQGEQ